MRMPSAHVVRFLALAATLALPGPTAAQIADASAVTLGLAGNGTASARGLTALSMIPAGLAMPGTRFSLALLPVQLRAGATAVAVRLQRLDFGASADLPVADVLLVDVQPQACPKRTVQRLRDGFGLTPREAECALGLYTIGSLEAVARCTGRSIHTVRTQLKAAMQKTSTHTQAGLVALVARQLER